MHIFLFIFLFLFSGISYFIVVGQNNNVQEHSKPKIFGIDSQCDPICGLYSNGVCDTDSGECQCNLLWFGENCDLRPVYFKQNISEDMDKFESISSNIKFNIESLKEVNTDNQIVSNNNIFDWTFYDATSIKGIRRYISSATVFNYSILKGEVFYYYTETESTLHSYINPIDHLPVIKSTNKYEYELQDYEFQNTINTLLVDFVIVNIDHPLVSISQNSTTNTNNLLVQYYDSVCNKTYGTLLQFTSRSTNSTNIYPIDIIEHSIVNDKIYFTIQISQQFNETVQFELFISYLSKFPSNLFNNTPSPCEYTECEYPTVSPPYTSSLPDFLFGNSIKLHIPIHLIMLIIIFLIIII